MFERLRGTRDFLPNEMAARKKVFSSIKKTVEEFGFFETDTPAIELFELYSIKSGEEIIEELYAFEDKGGRMISLRPELTPSVVRVLVSRAKELSFPVKWYSIPRLWRYERPQSGRLREFYQLNIDIFGSDDPRADTEVISCAIKLLCDLGFDESDIEVRISDRRMLQEFLLNIGIEKYHDVLKIIDKREKVSQKDFKEMLLGLKISEPQIKEIDAFLNSKGNFLESIENLSSSHKEEGISQVIESLRRIAQDLNDRGFEKFITFDPSIVRGLDYYTGMVFEVHDRKREFRALFGGGRYDNLAELFGGEHIPAVGFGMGDAVLELMMRRKNIWPEEKVEIDLFIATIGNVEKEVSKILTSLRNSGYKVDFDIMNRNLSNQIKFANKLGAKSLLIVGERDLKEGNITLRDLKTGNEAKITLEEFVSSPSKYLTKVL
ncbi:MAG: Histidine--tRNA ligase [Candidatus Methanofastidiosum methylothiophilum]|uniref:Histidine--tRNA ligase n=1 Tax=Candidatus Methanofastidiosum methylothiophilum TaxID=1705564 RepID=A0A150II32_9EURY|nr:MAG: Histidine--tRNA ligase [Candidatus Methanofastidiosum methylthiophilus]KYC46957.1 MAG: Histidine--tRNA ligase [Candidatus Methanofastidiosum methylthiophilus]KYC49188.1 MAG: Histidine--tRNA ligase [Candidatus Methanofastidiosum methylthiophilus]